jgi:CheY-like chemotaxis protein
MAAKSVLVIGHNWRMRKLIQANLEAFGVEVQGAVNGHHGLSLLDKHNPDLILVDTDVPGMEVSYLLARLQDHASLPVPIIVLCTEPPSRLLSQNEQAISYLLKPFAALTLLQEVGRSMGGTLENERQSAQDG